MSEQLPLDPRGLAGGRSPSARASTGASLIEPRERLLRALLVALFSVSALGLLMAPLSPAPLPTALIALAMLVAEGAAFLVMRRGAPGDSRPVRRAGWILTGAIWIVLALGAIAAQGIANTLYYLLMVVTLVAGLVISRRASFFFAGLTMLVGLVILAFDLNNALINIIPFNPYSFWLFTSLGGFAVAWIVGLASTSMLSALEMARQNEQTQAQINLELQHMQASLEEQVAARTVDLQQHTRYLQASIEVSRATASILDAGQLLQIAVDRIRQQFDLYYAGIFVVDAAGEWAVLQAGTGQAGQAMRQRGHRIRVGSGMIGWSIANRAARIAQESSADAVRLANPELPDTRSEAAIPLQSRGRVLGALSVQSVQPNAFADLEISTFQAIADQLATALDNARLLADSQLALQEAQRAYGAASRQAWEEFLRSRDTTGLSFAAGNLAISPAASGQGQAGQPGEIALDLPILIREQPAGTIRFQRQAGQPVWTEEETSLLQALAEQLGIAIDSARLYQDTQRLAYREKLISEVTARVRETLDIDTVLQAAVQEIQSTLRLPEVLIALQRPETTALPPEEATPANGRPAGQDGGAR